MAERKDRLVRELVTPEGAVLHLRLASAGSRAAAFTIDAAIMLAALIALTIAAAGLLTSQQSASVAAILWLLGFFLLRNFYFTLFESGGRAATLGKRALKLRVVARDGGRLTGGAVLARNLTREIEVFLPLIFLLTAQAEGFSSRWLTLFGFGWTAIFMLFPLFNRDRLRAGDLVAGTWVVRTPKQRLGRDMADHGSDRLHGYDFTPAQIDAYGQHELHVLELVLRQRNRETMRIVAERIATKIGWPRDPSESDHDFLSAYYAALRGRLEQRLLMGRRRLDKHDV